MTVMSMKEKSTREMSMKGKSKTEACRKLVLSTTGVCYSTK